MMNKPFVSVSIPCRNEEKYIGNCLDSIIANDYPKENLEVLVVDGMSDDNTRKIIEEYISKYPFIKIINNPNKFTPFAWNIGIKESRGEIIVLMGAHSTYHPKYISKSVEYLEKYKADNIGGIKEPISGGGLVSRAIVLSLSNLFGAGGLHFKKRRRKPDPRLVDTVFCGCYRKETFKKIGMFNEKLIRSQDMELNLRLKKAGGKILLSSEIISYYHPKEDMASFFKHNFVDGIWAIYPLKFTKTFLRLRHYIPFLFVSFLIITGILGIFYSASFKIFIVTIALYFILSLFFSAKASLKEKNILLLFVMPIAFLNRHIAYGSGSIVGVIKLFFPILGKK